MYSRGFDYYEERLEGRRMLPFQESEYAINS